MSVGEGSSHNYYLGSTFLAGNDKKISEMLEIREFGGETRKRAKLMPFFFFLKVKKRVDSHDLTRI